MQLINIKRRADIGTRRLSAACLTEIKEAPRPFVAHSEQAEATTARDRVGRRRGSAEPAGPPAQEENR